MSDPINLATMAATALVGLGMLSAAALKGWAGWLDLQHAQMGCAGEGAPALSPSQRIEIADLKERIRKLEAIAAGVDL